MKIYGMECIMDESGERVKALKSERGIRYIYKPVSEKYGGGWDRVTCKPSTLRKALAEDRYILRG